MSQICISLGAYLNHTLTTEKGLPHDNRFCDNLEKDNVFLKRISISRRFLSRLSSARKHMMKYYSAPSGAELASCIKSLEDLSFETLALQLEEKELRKHPEFKNSFEKNIK